MGICGMALTLGSVPIYRWNKYEATTILPSGYTPVEYIQSSGTQRINTGFIGNQNTRLVIDCQAATLASSGNALFGSRGTNITNAFAVFITSTQGFFCFGSKYGFFDHANTYERMTVEANKNTFTMRGSTTTTGTLNAATFSTPSALFIGSAYDGGNGGPYSGSNAWFGKIYSCQIYDNDTLVRDFVPCTDSSGAAGLYDLVNDVFYANAGTGVFSVGAESENIAVGDFIEEVKSLNSNAYPDGAIQDGYYYERVV